MTEVAKIVAQDREYNFSLHRIFTFIKCDLQTKNRLVRLSD